MKLRHFYFVKNIFCFCHTALICRSWYGVVCAIFFFLVIEKGQLQAQTTITKSIEASSDDAEETGPDGIYNGVGYVALTSIRIELVRDDQSPTSGAQIVGLRFNSLSIPKGATITNAYITFKAVSPVSPNTNTGVTNLTIKGHASDNPSTFVSSTSNISNRATTTASVSWSSLSSWTVGNTYDTPALNGIVQELVNRSGWSSGNSIAFIITGSGSRSSEAWDDSPSNQALLTIQYTTISLSGVVTNVSVPGGSDGMVDLSVTSGTSPYTYSWSNGATTQDISNLIAGTYTVTVTDANSATATASYVVLDGIVKKQLYLSGATQLMDREDPVSVSQTLKSTGTLTSPAIGVLNSEYRAFDNANTFYGSYTSPDGPNRLLLTGISIRNTSSVIVDSVRYNNIKLTQVSTIENGTNAAVYIYTLVNPPVGTYNLDVFFSNSASKGAIIGISTLHGVHQTTPTGTPSTGTGSTNSISLSIASAIGDLVFGIVTKRQASSSFTTSETQEWNAYIDETRGGGNSKVATSTSTTLNWTATNGNSNAMVGVAVKQAGGNPTTSFTQSPVMCSNFVIKAGTVKVENYLNIISGTMPASPNITAVLKYDAVNIITLTNPTYNSGTGKLTWTGTLGSDVTVPSGKAVVLEVTTSEPLVQFQIQYDHSSKPSLVEFNTSTYVNISTVDMYSAAYPSGSIITSTTNGSTTYIRAVVSDPFGYSDITGLTASIVSPASGPFSATSVATSGCTRTYEYVWNTPATPGDFVISAVAKEGYENTVTFTKNLTVSLCPLSVTNSVTQPTSCVSSNGAINLTVTGAGGPYTWSWTRTSPSGSGSGSGTSLTSLAAGTYTITVTSTRGCTGTTSAVLNVPTPPSATATITNVSCNGGSNGQIVQAVSGGSSPYTYIWSGSAVTTKDRTSLAAGTYTVTVTNAGGCTSSSAYTVTQPAAMTIIPTITHPTCSTNGSISFTTGGGGNSAPFTWNWARVSPAATGSGSGTNITNLIAGTYNITVTSTTGCTATTSSVLVQSLPPSVSGFITDVTCFGGNNGVINHLVQGGGGSFTFLWSGGSTSANRTGLSAGSYTVTVSDGNNCTVTKTYVVSQPSQVAINPTVTQPTCIINGSVSIAISGGKSPYVSDWADMAGTNNTSSRSGLSPGTYSLTVTDSKFCSASYSTVINPPSSCPSALEVCISDIPETFSTTPDPTVSSYTWTVPTGAVIISGQGTISIRVNWAGVPVGSDLICVSTSNSCGPGQQYCRTIITKGLVATVTSSPPCAGNDLILYSSGGINYTWTGPNGFASTSDNPVRYNTNATHSGYYAVTITDNNGCKATGGLNVNIEDPPSASFIPYNAGCGQTNGFIDLSVFGGASPYNYIWSNGTTTQDNVALSSGNYIVTVTDANGCITTGSASIGEVNGPSVNLTGLNIPCYGSNSGTIENNVSGGTAPYSYYWSHGATTKDLTNLPQGLYEVTVVDANGCADVKSISIFEPRVLFADRSVTDVLCNGSSTGSITVNVTGGISPYSIMWAGGATTFQRTLLSAGTYLATVTDANGCQQPIQVVVSQPLAPLSSSLSATDVACFNSNNGSINQTTSGGTKPYSYQWSSIENPGFNSTSEDISTLQQGNYIVTVTDARGCSVSANALISQPDTLINSLTGTNLSCFKSQNGTITQTVSGGNSPYSYLWSDGKTTANRTLLQAGNFTVTVTDIKGCISTSTKSITEPAELLSTATPTHIECNSNASGNIVLSTSGGSVPFHYLWSNGSTTKDITNLSADNYIVTVSDNNNCSNIIQVQINQGTPFASDEFIKHVSCNGGSDGGIDYYVRGGVGPYTFAWSTGATTKDITDLSEGAYQVTFTDTKGCSASGFFIVSEPTFLYTANLIVDVNCYSGVDGIVTAYPTGGVGPYKLAWSSGSSAQTITVPHGTYTVTVTDSYGCVASTSSQVNEPAELLLSANITAPCPGQSNGFVSLNVSGGTLPYTFTWSNGGPSQQVRSGLGAGTYGVTLTDGHGCIKIISFDLIPLNGALQSFAPSCVVNGSGNVETNPDGEEYAVINGGNLPYTFTWSTGSNAPFITGLNAGTYTVTVTSGGCGIVKTGTLFGALCSPPVAVDDHYVTEINVPITNGSVALNDYDPNNEFPLTFIPLGFINSVAGTITWDSTFNGAFSFYPATNFTGTLEIPYQLCDSMDLCVQAKLFITVSKPVLGLSKRVSSSPMLSGQNAYDFTYTVEAHNLSALPLNILQITDKLDTAFAGAVSWSVTSIQSPDFTVNNSYNGTSNINLLSGAHQLSGLSTGTINLGIHLVPGTNLGPYYNSARVTGESPAFTPLSDISQNGFNPDPDNDGDPTNNNAPTPVLLCPVVNITGNSEICIGATTTLTSVPNGTWISSNSAIAQVNNSGVVVGIAAGKASFTFIESSSGCITNATDSITVLSKPVVAITGLSDICAATTTTLSPTTGGYWTSSNTSVATVTNNGIVTGKIPGKASFYFTNAMTGCTSVATDSITVRINPTINFTGDSILCVGSTTNVNPTSGGTWISSNPTVATITQAGLVTAISNGLTYLSYTTDAGCSRNMTLPVIVKGNTFVQMGGPAEICNGTTTQLLPSSGGTWISNQPSIASVSINGLVSGLAVGYASFYFTDSVSGCLSNLGQVVTVLPSVSLSYSGPSTICEGSVTNVLPATGGVWFSSNNDIATVSSSGSVSGLSPGLVTFTYISSSTGCAFQLSPILKVNARPVISMSAPGPICQGGNISLLPSTGGSWVSNDSLVASVTNSGLVTGLLQGTARFTYTVDSTGCTSLQSELLTVHARPTISISGSSNICEGAQTMLLPTSGGTWASTDNNIAIVDNSGSVLAISAGQVRFYFSDSGTGCTSDVSGVITVSDAPDVSVTGSNDICAGFRTTLSPTSGGVWTSSNSNIATVTITGIVTGVSYGQASFRFTSSVSGCTSAYTTPPIIVNRCILNDFNITKVNISVSGNVSTNDVVPGGYLYSTTPILVSKPSTGTPVINMSSNGSYTFVADASGTYEYTVSLCSPVYNGLCIQSVLTILVSNIAVDGKTPIAVDDRAVTFANANPALPGIPVTLPSLANDHCLYNIACALDPTSVLVTVPPQNGFTSVDGAGNITYTPGPGFVGSVTLRYRVCIEGEPANCASAIQLIDVLDESQINLNSTHAVDDFYNTNRETSVSGNVLTNDYDAEGDMQTVIAKGTAMSPVLVTGGSYYLSSTGNFTFTPALGFSGPASFVYKVCDNNAVSKCDSATVYLYVTDDISFRIRVYLEGALNGNGNAVGSTGRPLMRDNLRSSPFTGSNYIPMKDPYKYQSAFVDVRTKFIHKGAGLLSKFDSLSNANTVLSAQGENSIVDWVFVEFRSESDSTLVLVTRSGLLQRDGDIVDLDGISPLRVPGIGAGKYFVVVRHRNHMGVMSKKVHNSGLIDFTSPQTEVFDYGNTLNNGYDYTGLAMKSNVVQGYKALWAGDFDGDKRLKFVNPNDDLNILFFDVLIYPGNSNTNANYDFSYGYLQGDYNMDGKSKFDNPSDDKNLIFSQILLHPLNSGILSNFNYIIEQVPPARSDQ